MLRSFIIPVLAMHAFLLSGCISFQSTEAASPDAPLGCAHKEQHCRELCGDQGVQEFQCKSLPGEGVELKCLCRRPIGRA